MVRRAADLVRAVLALLGPLGAGSRVLLLRLLGRWGFWWVLGGAAAAAYAAFRYRTWTAWMLVAWCVAAWMHAPSASKQLPAEAKEDGGEEASGPRGEAWRAFVDRAIGDRQGVHLRDLLDRLHQAGHHPGWEVADVRRVCEAAGIPVRNRVRVRGLGVTVGVHRDDLPALPNPSPDAVPQDPPDPELHVA